eukprot:TRINITY_DN93666_c0_g1_i1.p1 TRINITY_DN93666_c0_g1~~TRINITY_DN93666_c0_g1_i1.p1  ORF type:complete len:983 (-),score=152.76 TRINITY_DN93666_c0_g1_i1:27-2975(-)
MASARRPSGRRPSGGISLAGVGSAVLSIAGSNSRTELHRGVSPRPPSSSSSRAPTPGRRPMTSGGRGTAGSSSSEFKRALIELEALLNNLMPSITVYNLTGAGFDESAMQKFLECLNRSGNGSLRELTLKAKQATHAAKLFSAIVQHSDSWARSLSVLKFECAGIGDGAAYQLEEFIRNSKTIEKLDLRQNSFSKSTGLQVASALQANASLTELDLSENNFDAEVGLAFASTLRTSQLRDVDLSYCHIPDRIQALIEAVKTFRSDVWAGTCSKEGILAQARAADLQPAINAGVFKIADLKSYMEGIVHFWPKVKGYTNVSHVLAALHAPISYADPANEGNEALHTTAITQLASIYVPTYIAREQFCDGINGSGSLQLPRDLSCHHRQVFILNLTPFDVHASAVHFLPFSGALAPLPRDPQFSVSVQITSLPQLRDLLPSLPAEGLTLEMRLAPGENRYVLPPDVSAADRLKDLNGKLRTMFSQKTMSSGKDANMLTLLWSMPARLRGFRLKELHDSWMAFQKTIADTSGREWIDSSSSLPGQVMLWSKLDRNTFVYPTGQLRGSVVVSSDMRGHRFLKMTSNPDRRKMFAGPGGGFLTATEDGQICWGSRNDECSCFELRYNNEGSVSLETCYGTFVAIDLEQGSLHTVAKRTKDNDTSARFFLLEGPNMYDIARHWIHPETASSQSSMSSLLSFGAVTVFVSHYWGEPIKDTLMTLSRHERMLQAQGSPGGVRYWLCSIANNQRRIAEDLGADIDSSPFGQTLRSDSCIGMALMFGLKGSPLTRFWCLYEITTIVNLREREGKANLMFDICMPSGVITRGESNMDRLIDVGKMVAEINVEDASCTDPEDRRRIDARIRETEGGYARMNAEIRQLVAKGLEDRMSRMDEELHDVQHHLLHDDTSPMSEVSTAAPDSSPGKRLSLHRGLDKLSSEVLELKALVEAQRSQLKAKDNEIRRQRELIRIQAATIKKHRIHDGGTQH